MGKLAIGFISDDLLRVVVDRLCIAPLNAGAVEAVGEAR
jgi:hypothetical protein